MKLIPIKPNPIDWKKTLYVATFKEVIYDDEGNEIRTYNEPVEYEYNYQPVSSYLDIQEFGKDATKIQKMVLPISDKELFKEYDLAYLNGAVPFNKTSDTSYQEDKVYFSENKGKYKELEAGTDYNIGDEIEGNIYEKEPNFGDNANYVFLPPKVGNAVVIIYCQKIKGK
jgi:hypothetical protein